MSLVDPPVYWPVAFNWIVPPLPSSVKKPDCALGATPLTNATVSVMVFKSLVWPLNAPQPTVLRARRAHPSAARICLHFTAGFLPMGTLLHPDSSRHPRQGNQSHC